MANEPGIRSRLPNPPRELNQVDPKVFNYFNDLIRELELKLLNQQSIQNATTSNAGSTSAQVSVLILQIASLSSVVGPSTSTVYSQGTSAHLYFGLTYEATGDWEIRRVARNVNPVVKSVASVGTNPTEITLASAWDDRFTLVYT